MKIMNVVINESYEAAAAEWQYQMILVENRNIINNKLLILRDNKFQ